MPTLNERLKQMTISLKHVSSMEALSMIPNPGFSNEINQKLQQQVVRGRSSLVHKSMTMFRKDSQVHVWYSNACTCHSHRAVQT